jgi:hypothetical protein
VTYLKLTYIISLCVYKTLLANYKVEIEEIFYMRRLKDRRDPNPLGNS